MMTQRTKLKLEIEKLETKLFYSIFETGTNTAAGRKEIEDAIEIKKSTLLNLD
jgi:hypothetical protein